MKKILILGASITEARVVEIAKECGYYTIVTDYNTDHTLSPAKDVADEAWDISWSDLDALEVSCKKNNVEGILAGFSEIRVDCMIELCRRLNLPSYITKEQLEITKDKLKFKQLCSKFNVPIVREYNPDDADIKYPVIIKPTDRGGSIGIRVAYSKKEYKECLEYAMSLSLSKSVVVEDFIGDGIKFDCSYYISKGNATLIETCDTTMLCNQKGCETMQKAWTFPSKFESEYIEQVDKNVKEMLISLGMECGVANISFFYRNGAFYVFETGFRLGGGLSFDYQRASHGIDYLSQMLKYACGDTLDSSVKIDKNRGYAVTYGAYIAPEAGSIVEKIEGEEFIKNIGLETYLPYIHRGKEFQYSKPQKFMLCTLCSETLEDIVNKVKIINANVYVNTSKGRYSIYCPLTENEIKNAFNI